jgi:CubicO group peptidase (beta-lactamase class C family)
LSAQVDEVVRAQIREQHIPGVTLAVMRDGKIIKVAAYGFANLELKVPLTTEMLFKSGSLVKQFTATSIMMLVEEGKVGLDDEISKYLPEAPTSWKGVTIRRLLTHTSGIRDFFGEDGDPKFDPHRDYSEDEWIRLFSAQSMRFSPGDKWSYCNAGYILLGAVIHRVTGKTWFEFEKERIFDPLGMTSVRLISTDDVTPNRASGYVRGNKELKNEPWVTPSWASTACGSLYLTVLDMAKWDAALYTERLIRRSSLEEMWTPVKLNGGSAYPYGFAWRTRYVNGHRLMQHDGVETAFTTRFVRYVDDGISIVVLMNLGEDDEALMPTRMTDSVAAIYIPSLADSKSQTTASDASKSTPSAPLSPKQTEVWKGEENLQAYEQQKDLKRFLSIWDEHFVGWPSYEQSPAYKPQIEATVAEEFGAPQTTSPPLPPPRPLAVGLFGDVAVTYYFRPEADQSSPTVYRVTHTWQKGSAGWHIIGGMGCEVPRQ